MERRDGVGGMKRGEVDAVALSEFQEMASEMRIAAPTKGFAEQERPV